MGTWGLKSRRLFMHGEGSACLADRVGACGRSHLEILLQPKTFECFKGRATGID